MTNISYRIINDNGRQTISVVDHNTGNDMVANDHHPNFEQICGLAREVALGESDDVESLFNLIDVEQAVKIAFERVTDRLTVRNGQAEFDGVQLENDAADAMVKALSEGDDEGALAVARFIEKLYSSSSPADEAEGRKAVTDYVRQQLWNWLRAEDFSITLDGDILGYKGVQKVDGKFTSISSGRAFVDDVEVTGHIPNEPGTVITMPRDQVEANPNVGCSVGLHVGTWGYASDFGNGHVLQVIVNPRDVVSIPSDSHHQKLRTCRYEVLDEVSSKLDSFLYVESVDIKELDAEEELEDDPYDVSSMYYPNAW